MLPQLLVSSTIFFATTLNSTATSEHEDLENELIQLPSQLQGLLPQATTKFYSRLTRRELELVDESFLLHHNNLSARIEYVKKRLPKHAKIFKFVYTNFNNKICQLDRSVQFFYLWRVVHAMNDLLIYNVTVESLYKFVADVDGEWRFLNRNEQKQFENLFPSVANRINSNEFKRLVEIGRSTWSFNRFVVPTVQ
ncbi:hypothetical protein M3Y95_00994600 [Aphelenchoides besseyi]|nr:hypothetical protein M3Y95_00994600 [Aphelenchoides besseyi]